MRYTFELGQEGDVSEMAIVDAFTRLIFEEVDELSAGELRIIEAFRGVDENVLMDDHAQMGEYLRNLGVSEMIQLVSRIREQLGRETPASPARDTDADGRDVRR